MCREGDRTSANIRDPVSLEVFRVKATQAREDQVQALRRELRLKGVQPEASLEPVTHFDPKADELPGQP